MKLDNLEISVSLKEKAKQVIKKAILSGELEAGTYYGIEEIVRQLNVSKTPVREALQDLEARGFVTFTPRKGILINKMTEQDIIHFFQYRLVMESGVVELVTKSITDEDVSTLRKYVELSKAGMREGDRLCVLKNDREMHMYLAQMTKNKFIIPELERIRDFLDWLILFKRARMMEALSEHDRLIECLSLRDTKGAVKAIRQHINNALQSTLDSLKADQPQQATEGQDT